MHAHQILAFVATALLALPQMVTAAPSPGFITVDQVGGNTTDALERRATSGPWIIENWKSRLILQPQGHSTLDGVQIEQGYRDELQAEEWYFTNVGSNYRIYNRGSGWCLNVKGASTSNSAKIIQWPCGTARSNDQWLPIKQSGKRDGQDYYQLKNAYSGKCLNVQGGSMVTGADLIQYDCNEAPTHNDWFTWYAA